MAAESRYAALLLAALNLRLTHSSGAAAAGSRCCNGLSLRQGETALCSYLISENVRTDNHTSNTCAAATKLRHLPCWQPHHSLLRPQRLHRPSPALLPPRAAA